MEDDNNKRRRALISRILDSPGFNTWLTRVSITAIILLLVVLFASSRHGLSGSQSSTLKTGIESQRRYPVP